MIELIGVVVEDHEVVRLNRLDLTARPGEVLGIVGLSGSGKSTALEVLAGLRAPDRGRIKLEGRDITRQTGRLKSISGWMGHTLPGPHALTVSQWLKLWADLDGVAQDVARTRLAEATEQLEMEYALDRPVHALSRGESRRLAMARLWILQPRVFLLDAPEEGVDGPGLRQISSAIRAASAGGATIICTAAAPYFTQSVCDRVICLKDGAAHFEVSRGEPDFSDRLAASLGWHR
ncbi:MAG: ATP-binding cassette domain-containing protein [Bradymonadia bacterium]